MTRGIALLALSLTALSVAPGARAAAGPNADDYRGGWETYGAGVGPHIYEFSIRGQRVRGIYCTECSDATTLAFVDGRLAAGGLTFTVTHVYDDGGTAYQDHATARIANGELIVTGTNGRDGRHFDWTLRKDPRGPAPVPGTPVNRLPPAPPVAGPSVPQRFGPPPYVAPGPWEPLSRAKVVGVWLGFGAGIDKQFFIIRRVGSGLRGMVCGRCDNPYTMAALDDFQIQGDTLRFDILHEDWGPGRLPSHNQVTAHIADNEMRISTELNNTRTHGVAGFEVHASLYGPVAAAATAGN
ncbi:MAG TPA: hypothetical protein VMD56_01205 [Steroidobacteraceae bacterium]|nr:hypothetical protein [Steroidobacteraceae bacterium]